jgi:protein O-mannosyl-transferase
MKSLRYLGASLCTAVLACAAFIPGLSGGFLFDDFQAVVANDRIQLKKLTLEGLLAAAKAYGGPYGRPVSTISLALSYWLHGMDASAFKIGNLVIHFLNIVLLSWLVRCLLELAWPSQRQRSRDWYALVIALAWGVHPLQVSAVLYVVQRMELLGHTFTLVSLLAYIAARKRQISAERSWPLFLTSCFACVLGLLAKENAAQLPLYTLILEFVLLRFRAKSATASTCLKAAYAGLFSIGTVIFVCFVLPSAEEQFGMRDFSMWERVMSQFRALPMYLYWSVWPSPGNLTFYHDNFSPSRGLLEPWTTLAGLAFLIALISLALKVRRRSPLLSVAIGFFFASHAITSGPLSLELIFEHRNYFALLSPLLAIASFIRLVSDSGRRVIAFVLVGALLLGFSFATVLRSSIWGNPDLFANSAVIDNRDSARAAYEVAIIYLQRSGGDVDSIYYSLAMAELKRASLLPRSSPLPEQAVIVTKTRLGQPIEPEWWGRMIGKFRTQALTPQAFSAFYAMHSARMDGLALPDDKLREISEIYVRRRPDYFEAHIIYADYAGRVLRDFPLAAREYCAAIKLKKDDPGYGLRVASSLVKQKRFAEAEALAPCIISQGNSAPAPHGM